MKLGAGGGVVLALALAGCTPGYVQDSEATVIISVTDINGGTPITSDVRGDTGQIVNCQVPVKIASVTKNPKNPGQPVEHVTLNRYDVSFTRADGRGAEGVDVPYHFSEGMAATVKPGDEITVSLDLVRQQAKLEPPLSNITGLQIVEMTVNLTVFGETVSRQTVSASGAAAIRFADFASGTKTCESGS